MSYTTIVNGKSYWTSEPFQADPRPEAPAEIVWRGYQLKRSPSVRYGSQFGWWNTCESRWLLQVDGGHARVIFDTDEGWAEVFEHEAAHELDALDGAAAKAQAWLDSLSEALRGSGP